MPDFEGPISLGFRTWPSAIPINELTFFIILKKGKGPRSIPGRSMMFAPGVFLELYTALENQISELKSQYDQ